MTEKWEKVIDLVQEINKNNFEDFNDNIVYHYFRRFQKELPFSFERHLTNIKKEKNLKFLKRSDVLRGIFSDFSLSTREDVVNDFLYKFHKHNASKRRILKLEEFLDNNRDELFGEKK
ncbi:MULTISPECIES: hypothetical protein [Psychrilyobacter]|uniref:Uncharacterized protein n=1 Tax=Psychrilyobacter piezotolerans TaxID=2293438 RepID=A0ABX9KI54_9FUSO|nr:MULTISPECIES: hypothetical protein [Psychrilyobacter]MCS5420215.1 hypothetical protein [Psychrilyobacter sp. S5]NDI77240.1 hypothetical protein [Psychrilyobacter piezotolerans]RDE63298.1 hypothetical protein DV867_05350 [Psychrilyobacter sp. S5]REI41840.1 hypothetical protein DYH56_05350 [Psychrilyobacter piezotolerans]